MTALRSVLFVALFYLWSAIFAISILPLLLAPPSWIVRALPIWSHGIHLLLRLVCGIKVEIRGKLDQTTAGLQHIVRLLTPDDPAGPAGSVTDQ